MGFFPARPTAAPDDSSGIELTTRDQSVEEDRERRWVEAAGRRAREIAVEVFGAVSASALTGIGFAGPFRGLLRLDVPFEGLEAHREREAQFLAEVERDELLSRVPLLFALGPNDG